MPLDLYEFDFAEHAGIAGGRVFADADFDPPSLMISKTNGEYMTLYMDDPDQLEYVLATMRADTSKRFAISVVTTKDNGGFPNDDRVIIERQDNMWLLTMHDGTDLNQDGYPVVMYAFMTGEEIRKLHRMVNALARAVDQRHEHEE